MSKLEARSEISGLYGRSKLRRANESPKATRSFDRIHEDGNPDNRGSSRRRSGYHGRRGRGGQRGQHGCHSGSLIGRAFVSFRDKYKIDGPHGRDNWVGWLDDLFFQIFQKRLLARFGQIRTREGNRSRLNLAFAVSASAPSQVSSRPSPRNAFLSRTPGSTKK